MITLDQWVEENCTEVEKAAYLESVARQDAIFQKMLEDGNVTLDSETQKWVFTDKHTDHQDDVIWAEFKKRWVEATGQDWNSV